MTFLGVDDKIGTSKNYLFSCFYWKIYTRSEKVLFHKGLQLKICLERLFILGLRNFTLRSLF